ncbi:MAG: S8 family serine peptidase [Candidatus Bipolaricaulia bacterium]
MIVAFLFALLSAVAWAEEPPLPKSHKSRTDQNPKIETKLEVIASGLDSKSFKIAGFPVPGSGIDGDRSGSIEVILEKKKGRFVASSSIRQVGGTIVDQTEDLAKVRLPPGRIYELARTTPGVRFIRLPHRPVVFAEKMGAPQGGYNTPGVNMTGASLYQVNNYLGQGVKIAVIDVGFASYNLAEESGQLPKDIVVETKDYTGNGFLTGSAHGTGVAEIAHDVAPSAKLYLKKVGDEVDLSAAVHDAVSQEVDIIVHSVGWLNTNFGDGTGVVADIAREATSNGILWVNAAGNAARKHWEGPIRDYDEDRWVEFATGKDST